MSSGKTIDPQNSFQLQGRLSQLARASTSHSLEGAYYSLS